MIKKIKKVKNLGIFNSYAWETKLPEFGRYNVIYGWNGSGKTTLSKLFDSLESGSHAEYPDLEYEIECDSAKFKNGEAFNKRIRVFNQDYIQNNLKIIEGKANSIVLILGEENKDLIEQIKKDEKELYGEQGKAGSVGKVQKLKQQNDIVASKTKERDKQFTDIARIISATGGEAVRAYNSKNAKVAFAKIKQPQILADQEIQHCNLVISQKREPEIIGIAFPEIENKEDKSNTPFLDGLSIALNDVESLLNQTVTSNVIDRLKQMSDVCEWVEAGIAIHKKHNSENCEFCNQKLPANRLVELANHFNDEDRKLKSTIDELLERLRIIYRLANSIVIPDRARFYEEFRDDFDLAAIEFEAEKKKILDGISDVGKVLTEKKLKTTETVSLNIVIDGLEFKGAIEKINTIITAHNLKISNLDKEKQKANEKLELHHLSGIIDPISTLDKALKIAQNNIGILENGDSTNTADLGIKALLARIAENQAKISTTQKACDNINAGLATFLGRKELTFEPLHVTVEEDGVKKKLEQGYAIKRNGLAAKHLSEGEKTAIAFVYFTVHLLDREFEVANGIIVVDDPISSLDSNSLFQSFAFLKNAVKDAHQIFLLTHNYDFLRLLLNWVHYIPKKMGKKGYYMVNNSYSNTGDRSAFLMPLDETLQKHESEYHYLFKCLYEFKSDGTILNVYHIPNIARKVLDTFLMFRVPNGKTGYEKLAQLQFDENKKTAIYKFTNDQSHITGGGFDPSLINETQNNVSALLEMMEHVFPEHYSVLVEYVKPEEEKEEEAVA